MTDDIMRGDTTLWDIPIVDDADAPYALNGCKVWVTSKADIADADEDALYQHFIEIDGSGAVIDSEGMSLGVGGAAGGIVVQELEPAESALFPPGVYTYDLQIKLANGRIYTSLNNVAETVIADVTRAIT